MIDFAVGIGAGLLSALLFGVVITGSPLAMLLSYVAPLPVLMAALGWNHRSGLVAAAVGGLAIALAFRFEAGLVFALGSALPAWWLAYLTLLGSPRPDGSLEWYPLGRLLLWIAVVSALVTFTGIVAVGGGDYGAYHDALRRVVENVVRAQMRLPGEAPLPSVGSLSGEQFVEALVASVPVLAAAAFALVLTLNLWIAARVVALSERLPRPWPIIPDTLMPRGVLLLLAAAVALAFSPGLMGVVAGALAGALVMAFALQGLALLHYVSRGRPGRLGLLVAVYILLVFLGHTLLPILALAGMIDTAVSVRRRVSGGTGSQST